MRKFFVGIFILLCSLALYAQSNGSKKFIDGYEDLQWGSSVEKVKNKYSNLSREWDAACQSGEECWTAVSDSVTRVFRFYNKKLYFVRVIYDDMTQQQFNALSEKLIDKYGKVYFEMEKDEKVKFGYQWLASSDLFVTLSVNNKINGFGAKMGEWIFVEYYSRSILNEMQSAEAENIEL